MRSAILAAVFLVVPWLAADATAQHGDPVRPSIDIPRVDRAPAIDDYLSGERPPGVHINGFLQRDPGDLAPPTEQTDAYVSYDGANLYVAFVCQVKDASALRARVARREQLFGDDNVAVFLDTFRDRQRAYMFFANPVGIQADGLTTQATGDDMSFDTVWNAAGRVTPKGYVVLFSIPFKSLRFPAGSGPQTWGIALRRRVPINNEDDFWPGISRGRNGFAAQFADARGFDGVSPGRNLQFIPYGTFTGARFLDQNAAAFDGETEARGGIDTKLVVRDAVTVDLTANPDFSQVESDEPQVTVNQRFEVFFPEKRPFFLENASYFQTPLSLFFSRRVRDPQVGGRVTAKVGKWAVGALAIDDRAPGRALPESDPAFGDRSFNALARAQRDFGESYVAALVTSRDFGPSFARVASLDSRVSLNRQWSVTGQAAISDARALNGTATEDTAFHSSLNKAGRFLSYSLTYQDIGGGFRSPLGFIPRTDIRQAVSFASVRWRPKNSIVQAFGPNSFVQYTWNRAGELQDWLVRFPFQIDLKGSTGLFVRRAESMERFAGIEFREHENFLNVYSSYIDWVDVSATLSTGTRPNFFPAGGITPFLGAFRDGSLSLTFRPTSRLLVDQTYIHSHLEADGSTPHTGTIFDNHIVRSRVNYQFTRELSLRGIADYSAILPNGSLIALERRKELTFDILLTYLLRPGTALYVGYTNGFQNVALEGGGIRPTANPTTSTGRQFFVKTSYLLRF